MVLSSPSILSSIIVIYCRKRMFAPKTAGVTRGGKTEQIFSGYLVLLPGYGKIET